MGLENLASFISITKVEGQFILKKKDINLMRFEIITGALDQISCRIISLDGPEKLLPYGVSAQGEDLLRWLESRFIPKNREFVEKIMSTLPQDGPRLVRLLKTTLGLSLIDDYWVVEDVHSRWSDSASFVQNDLLKWSDYNLYNNQFSEALSLLAFTGYGGHNVDGISSSPEYTTNGMLRKAWRRINGKIYLYKGGTVGYANAGLEPYSEFYSAQIARVMELDHVPYGLENWKGSLCSYCPLFTSEDYSYVTAASILGRNRLAEKLFDFSDEDIAKILTMSAFDFIVANKDRHAGNYGWLRNNNTGELERLAPIFDNGDSLCSYAMDHELDNLNEYLSDKQVTAFYIDANSTVLRDLLSKRMKERIRKLLRFKFERHGKYDLPEKRLKALESLVQERARMLI